MNSWEFGGLFFLGWHFLDIETDRWRCGKFWWWWTCWHCRRLELKHPDHWKMIVGLRQGWISEFDSDIDFYDMDVSQKLWYPQIIHFNRVFHYKLSILGYPYFWKHPYGCVCRELFFFGLCPFFCWGCFFLWVVVRRIKVTGFHRNFRRFRTPGNLTKNWLRREKDTCLKLS